MLNLNECRIGIIVLNSENEIVCLNKDHLLKEFGPEGNSFEKFNPIPITPGGLKALKFENKGIVMPRRLILEMIEKRLVFELYVSPDLYFFVHIVADIFDKENISYSVSLYVGEDLINMNRCLFLHDIQNAFLQTTGIELYSDEILKLSLNDNFNQLLIS